MLEKPEDPKDAKAQEEIDKILSANINGYKDALNDTLEEIAGGSHGNRRK